MESRDLQGDVARWVAAALRALLAEVGLPENDNTRHAVKRAALAGRRAAGMDDGNWDAQMGPRLSAAVRARLLREAADAAEREAAVLTGCGDR